MQNNFTSHFSKILAAGPYYRKLTVTGVFLAAILLASVYLKAAIVSTPIQLSISADKAWNGLAPAFTPINNLIIKEENDEDFKSNPGGVLILTAPAGWVFKASGVTTSVTNIGNGPANQVNVTTTNSNITYPTPVAAVTQPNSTTIRIPYATNGTNRLDQITFSGVEVMAIDGNNRTSGNITFSVNNAANIGGQLSVTVATLTQTTGSPQKIAFQTQPGATNNSLAGEDLLNQPRVVIQDFFGQVVSTAANPVSLSIQSGTSGAVLTAASANAVNGVATFSGVKLNAGGTYTLRAASQLTATGPPATVVSNAFTVSNNQPTITSVTPNCNTSGSFEDFNATVTGTNFAPGAFVRLKSLDFPFLPAADFDEVYITSTTSTQIKIFVPGLLVPIAPPGNYTVEVYNPTPAVPSRVSNAFPFTIYPILRTGAITGESSVCAGFTNVTYSVPAVAGAASYRWRLPLNATVVGSANTNQITVNFANATSGTVSVGAINNCGTIGPFSNLPVTVNQLPVASITAPNGAQSCTPVLLQATPTGATTYAWLLNGNTIPGAPNSPNYTALTSGLYSVRITNGTTCTTISNAIAVLVITPSNIITNGAVARFCAGSNVILQALTGPNYKYQWYNSQGAISGQTGASLTVSTPGTYYVTLTSPNNCNLTSGLTTVSETPVISNNTISATIYSYCVSANPGILRGSDPTGGLGSENYEFQWQSRTVGSGFADIDGAEARDYNPGLLTQTTYYRRIVTSGFCFNISLAIEIAVNPQITNNTITAPSPAAVCGNTQPGAIKGNPPMGGTGVFIYQWQRSTDNLTYSDIAGTNTPDYTPGTLSQTTYFRRVAASGGCVSTSDPVTIMVAPADTYTLVLTANPFPICQGNTSYRAQVIKNITDLTYPANADVRVQPVTWTGGQDVTSQFIFDWWKDDDINRRRGNLGPTISDAAIRSGEYYTVRARPTASLACATYNNRADLIPANDPDQNVLFSNRMYSAGSGQNFSVSVAASITGVICPGTAVTFTATPNQPNIPNPRYQWLVNGNQVPGQTTATFTSSTLNNNDKVSVTLNSAGNSCDGPATATPITMVVVVPQIITGGGTYCTGDNFGGAAIGLQDSQVGVLYQLMLGSTKVFFPLAGNGRSLNFGYHKFSSGTYTIMATSAVNPNNATCALLLPGSVTVVANQLITNSIISVSGPEEPQIGQSATYIANPVNTTIPWTYRWTILYGDGTSAQPAETSARLTINSIRADMIGMTVVQVAPPNSCVDVSTFTAPFQGLTPLPVEMLYLKAEKKQNNLVVLEWATAMEKMNEGFQIEVSQDAVNYRTLSFVPTKNGNTTAKQVYTFHDKENGKYGTRYYRIKQMDVDGTSEYFGPKAVQMDALREQIVAYPNPFTSEVNLDVNAEAAGSMHVIVTNAVGGKVLERTLSVQKGSNKAQLQLNPNLPLGMYIITTRLNGQTNHVKLMKK